MRSSCSAPRMMRIFPSARSTRRASETGISCNATRCAARYASDSGAVKTSDFMIGSPGRPAAGADHRQRKCPGRHGSAFQPARLQEEIRESNKDSFTRSILVEGRTVSYTPISLGRPYAMLFVPDFSFPLRKTARTIAAQPDFPEGTGIGFVQVFSREEARMRVWEGDETAPGDECACAAAALVASVVNGFTDREVFVHLKGRRRIPPVGGVRQPHLAHRARQLRVHRDLRFRRRRDGVARWTDSSTGSRNSCVRSFRTSSRLTGAGRRGGRRRDSAIQTCKAHGKSSTTTCAGAKKDTGQRFRAKPVQAGGAPVDESLRADYANLEVPFGADMANRDGLLQESHPEIPSRQARRRSGETENRAGYHEKNKPVIRTHQVPAGAGLRVDTGSLTPYPLARMETASALAAAGALALIVSIVMMPLVILIAHRRRWFDIPNERKIHTDPIPRLGGIGLFFGLLVSSVAVPLVLPAVFPDSWPVGYSLRYVPGLHRVLPYPRGGACG